MMVDLFVKSGIDASNTKFEGFDILGQIYSNELVCMCVTSELSFQAQNTLGILKFQVSSAIFN